MDQATMNAWAVAIADESMFAMLESECISEGERPDELQPTDEDCAAVKRLAEASAAVREAFAWLSMRGIVVLLEGAGGDTIKVLRRPEAAETPAEELP